MKIHTQKKQASTFRNNADNLSKGVSQKAVIQKFDYGPFGGLFHNRSSVSIDWWEGEGGCHVLPAGSSTPYMMDADYFRNPADGRWYKASGVVTVIITDSSYFIMPGSLGWVRPATSDEIRDMGCATTTPQP